MLTSAAPSPRGAETLTGKEGITELLVAWGQGDPAALEQLMPLVYVELRRIARAHLAREREGQSLQVTGLVSEAYLRLVDQTRVQWQNRAHFFAVAARLMRRIVVDHARARCALKRGGGAGALPLDGVPDPAAQRDARLLDLDAALQGLAEQDPRASRIVELRYFGGLSIEEVADALALSPATVKREWSVARAWLHGKL
jgi:RNA polymerase sigma factor (TIGR02999 family)